MSHGHHTTHSAHSSGSLTHLLGPLVQHWRHVGEPHWQSSRQENLQTVEEHGYAESTQIIISIIKGLHYYEESTIVYITAYGEQATPLKVTHITNFSSP